MPTKVLRVEPKPDPSTTTTLVAPSADKPIVQSTGDLDVLCGGCRAVLLKSITPGQVTGCYLLCAGCGSHGYI